MSNSLREVQRLINPRAIAQGEVISIDGSQAQVRTLVGVKTAIVPSNLVVRTGQRVQLEGASIIGLVKSESGLPVFQV